MSSPAVGNTVFSPVIFFIAFREALEASLVIGILIASLESLVKPAEADPAEGTARSSVTASRSTADADAPLDSPNVDQKELRTPSKEDIQVIPAPLAQDIAPVLTNAQERAQLIRKLRKCVLLGALCGLLVAFSIGAAFLAVFYTQVNDLWSKAEELWEGIFNLVAVCLIVPMSLAILRLNSAKEKWSRKLSKSFDKSMKEKRGDGELPPVAELGGGVKKEGRWARFNAMRSKPAWALFILPFVTTLREGLEGVIFVGGVSLGLPATSIPLPAIVGLAVGFGIGLLIWKGGPMVGQVRYFLLFATCALFIIAAGMAARAVYYLQFNTYIHLVGGAAAESGSGPGSYDAKGAVIAHFNCCNPEIKSGGNGWGVLSSLIGWNNTWTYGTVFMYIGFWLLISAYLNYTMWKEGRLALAFSWRGREHRIWESRRRRERRERKEAKEASSSPQNVQA